MESDHIKWFRASSPYINAHRGKTFVIHLPGDSLLHENFVNIINDLALLYSLGVKLVLVFDAEPQIATQLDQTDQTWEWQDSWPITPPLILDTILATIGQERTLLEAQLSASRAATQGLNILVTSGNLVRAKPLGIINGVDYQQTGLIRSINSIAINSQLDQSAIVVVPPVGYSPSGETFVLDSKELAQQTATALTADKLIYLIEDRGLRDSNGDLINELQQNHPELQLSDSSVQRLLVERTTAACVSGVRRCHVISYAHDAALLEELFTVDGSGTQIVRQSYERIRRAGADDVSGIIDLITPLENEGALVRRSRELIEAEIDHFTIIERDGMIVGCAALYPFGSVGELACLATHADYRNGSRGELLLQTVESDARSQGLSDLFVLTTQAAHWFLERGFVALELDSLPIERRSFYNLQRNSRCLAKSL